jgi:hypothetical protein
VKPVKAQYDAFDNEERRLSQRLRADPKLVKANARISVGARASMFWRFYWDIHKDDVKTYENDLVNRPIDGEELLEAVPKALKPPFVPRAEKRLDPLD